ncbi:DUF3307 domain-containing protein [Sagittula sp. S175]|uniref:DUF3307 domain-containing protein n=1 Tax=Sagittula sp. S175 TaxID=3415129 RepID=UPI003C7A317C
MTLTAAMLQTFVALLAAHMLGDFLLQTGWMVRRKRNVFVLLLHVAIHGALVTLALGGVWQVALVAALAHLVIDIAKTYALPRRWRDTLAAFLTDQALHLATLAWIALQWPGAASAGMLAPYMPQLTPALTVLAGGIATILAGGFAVGLLTARFAQYALTGLPEAGRVIGQLERALIFLLVLVDQPAAIGFLIAAKSILRFNDASEDQQTAEYVIIGTLASFGWALAGSYATRALLEIVAATP